MYVYQLLQLCGSNSCRSIEDSILFENVERQKISLEGRKAGCRTFLGGGGKWKSQMTDKAQTGSLQLCCSFVVFGLVISLSDEFVKTFSLISVVTHLLVVRHSSRALKPCFSSAARSIRPRYDSLIFCGCTRARLYGVKLEGGKRDFVIATVQ